jgi:hypothetical protein
MKTLIRCLVYALLLGGCATAKFTIEDQSALKGKPTSKEKILLSYVGTSWGARELIDASTRRRDSAGALEVAKQAVKKDMPVSLGTTPNSTSVQVQQYYPYGYGYGTYGYDWSYGGANLGYTQSMLPRLGEASVSLPPLGSEVQQNAIVQVVECPKDLQLDQMTHPQRHACHQSNQEVFARKLWKSK